MSQAHLNGHHERVVHLFIYDDFWFAKLPLTGLQKTGPIRARFLNEAVADLRAQLRERGSDLLIRRGPSSSVIQKLVQELNVRVVHSYKEVQCYPFPPPPPTRTYDLQRIHRCVPRR